MQQSCKKEGNDEAMESPMEKLPLKFLQAGNWKEFGVCMLKRLPGYAESRILF